MMPFDRLQRFFRGGKSDAFEKTKADLFPEVEEEEEEETTTNDFDQSISLGNGDKKSKKSDGGGFFGSGW
jgi:hypothetical protein